jgi:ligand-binding SRPBCC domain-containing protein
MPKVYEFRRKQIIKTDLDTAWNFMRSPSNLNKITPPDMTFNILSDLPDVMFEGQIIRYKIKIPFIGEQNWVSELKHIKDKHSFVDDQRIGPYTLWYHYHEINECPGGVEFIDHITYSIPMGIFGQIAHWVYVRKQLKKIFDFREKTTPKLLEKD